jgi:tetratricopeptide (TPR) repeat protein
MFKILDFAVVYAQNPNEAKRLFEEAERLYKSNNWTEAATLYERARSLNPDKYKAITPYKRGLCFAKLKNCDSLKANFSRALLADPLKGGASSLAKLDEKLVKCGISVSDLRNNPVIAQNREVCDKEADPGQAVPGAIVDTRPELASMPFERELGEGAMALLGIAWISGLWLLITGLRLKPFTWLEKSLVYLLIVWLASQLGYAGYSYDTVNVSVPLLIIYLISILVLFLKAGRATFETDRIFWSAWLGLLLVAMLYQARFEAYQLYVLAGMFAVSILARWFSAVKQYNSRHSAVSTKPDVFSWNRTKATPVRKTGYDSVNRKHSRGDGYHSSDTFVYVDNSRTYSDLRDDS